MNLIAQISGPKTPNYKNIVWEDVKRNKYLLSDIGSSHLLNILKFIQRGGGYGKYVVYSNIRMLHEEALRRGLKPHATVRQIHQGNLYNKEPF